MISHDLSVLAADLRPAGGHVRRPAGRDRAVAEVIAEPLASLHAGAGRGLPALGDPASRLAPAACRATRPTSARRLGRLSVRAALPERCEDAVPAAGGIARVARATGPRACVLVTGNDERRSERWLSRDADGPPRCSRPCGLAVTFPPRRGHGAARAVDGVNLALGRGEILALIGESGCGKSHPGSGAGRAWSSRPRRDPVRRQAAAYAAARALREFRRHVQLVLQDPSARSTRARTSTTPSPRVCGCTGSATG